MLICFNYVGVVTEALTAKEIVDLFWYEVDVDPVLFFYRGCLPGGYLGSYTGLGR